MRKKSLRSSSSKTYNNQPKSLLCYVINVSFFVLIASFLFGFFWAVYKSNLNLNGSSISSAQFFKKSYQYYQKRLENRFNQLEHNVKQTIIDIERLSMTDPVVITNNHPNKKTSNSVRIRRPKRSIPANLLQYTPPIRSPNNTANLSFSLLQYYAQSSQISKGETVAYNHDFHYFETNGTYFKYRHNYSDNCTIADISHKYMPECGDDKLNVTFVRQLLIVAVQRSGTHYEWEMLNRLGIHVHHEGVGPDGAISWLYSFKLDQYLGGGVYTSGRSRRSSTYINPITRKPPPNRYVINNRERLTLHKFRYVFHQVRHPLRVISTLIKRAAKWDRIWLWISYMEDCHYINKYQAPIRRAMLLWIIWNRHIEKYADIRFRSEETSPRDVCIWSGFPSATCAQNNGTLGTIIEPMIISKPTGEESPLEESSGSGEDSEEDAEANNEVETYSSQVTWSDLERVDLKLADEIKIMCLEYGYDLDPSRRQQLGATRDFTA